MVRLISLILAIGLFTGCANRQRESEQTRHQPQKSERATHSYSLGMSRKELRAELADSWLLVSASRPVNRWSHDVSPPAGGRAGSFENSHAALLSMRVKSIGSAIPMRQQAILADG